MAFEIGIASNYRDALNRLKDLCSDPERTTESAEDIIELSPISADQAHEILRWNTDYDGEGGYEMILKAPGISGEDEIFSGIRTYYHSGQDYYNWSVQGFTNYDEEKSFHEQPGAIPNETYKQNPKVLLFNEKIKYWFVVNGLRYVGFLKVSNVYESFWAGFPLLYGLPVTAAGVKYYPLIIGGSSCGSQENYPRRYSSTEVGHRAFWDGFYGENQSTIRMLWQGTWLSGGNWRVSGDGGYILSSGINIWPYLHSGYYSSPNSYPYKHFIELKENIDGSRPSFELVLNAGTPEKNIYGELMGLRAVPGFGGLSGEDILRTPEDERYVAFPNVFRNNFNNFVALKLE